MYQICNYKDFDYPIEYVYFNQNMKKFACKLQVGSKIYDDEEKDDVKTIWIRNQTSENVALLQAYKMANNFYRHEYSNFIRKLNNYHA